MGAYRLGPTADILPRHGIRGLYTSTLFRYRKELFERLEPAVELGRSFIRPEYQKQYAPFLPVPDDLLPYYRAAEALIAKHADPGRARGYLDRYLTIPAEGNEPTLPQARQLLADHSRARQ